MVAFAKENKQEVKGHALVWHGAVPAYLSKLSSKELDKEVSTHINTVVGRYKLKEGETGRIRWDVVNEAIDDQGPGLRKTIFSENLGQDYIANCFRIAHKADPKAILIYNDYGCETLSPKSDRQYEMLKGLIAKKVPVHEVGLQMHVGFYRNGEVNIKELQLNVKRLAALGLKVNISEMDVPIGALPEGSVEERLKVQADRTKEILAACIDIKGFVGVTWWGFTDMCTWCSEPEKPLLFGRDLQGKPAFHAVLEVLAMKKDKRR